jgi:hypothetical protein
LVNPSLHWSSNIPFSAWNIIRFFQIFSFATVYFIICYKTVILWTYNSLLINTFSSDLISV